MMFKYIWTELRLMMKDGSYSVFLGNVTSYTVMKGNTQ